MSQNSNTRIHIVDSTGVCIFSDLYDYEIDFYEKCTKKYETDKYNNTWFAQGKTQDLNGTIYLISFEQKFTKSSSAFRARMDTFLPMLTYFANLKNEKVKHFSHDIPKIHGHNIQEIFRLIPQTALQNIKTAQDQIKYIESIVSNNPDKAAKALLKIIKNNSAISNELTMLDVGNEKEYIVQLAIHPAYRVLHNALVNFLNDFNEIKVYVQIEPNQESIIIDYTSFNSALISFFENAVKYVLEETRLEIYFTEESKNLVINVQMISLQIKGHEVKELTKDGYSGEMAKLTGKAGHGLGMTRIKHLLSLSNGKIETIPNINQIHKKKIGDTVYELNLFKIFVPKYHKQNNS